MASSSVPRAIVTGTSSGVGAYLAAILAQNGYLVYATMRTPSSRSGLVDACKELNVAIDNFDEVGSIQSPGIRIREMDVSVDQSIENCLNQIFAETDRDVDVCVNNAGYSEGGGVEAISMESARKQFDTNFFGLLKVTQMVLPLMREREKGKMIAISSVGGINGVPFNDIYCASKFAVEGMYESMASLYKAFNVYVTLVEPGPIASKFVQNAHRHTASPSSEEASHAHPTLLKLKAMEQSYAVAMASGFSDLTRVQTSEDVARSVFTDVISVDSPNVRHQTNKHPMYVAAVSQKLADVTGNKARDMMYQRFFEGV